MHQEFSLPTGLLGRFAVVKLWPDIKTAEDECIARLKIAALALGLECIEIHADGGLLSAPGIKVSSGSVDFVLHLHYDTPKRYDAFSIVALWNPLKFYHEWGYARTSRNLTSHDDFISCSSNAADDHVARMVLGQATHLPAKFRLYHSTADVIHGPSLGDGKLFYAGINWEAISGGKSRHGEVLKRLDKTGLLRIYGPKIFQKVKVWAGYDSYVREVPFDGYSMIDEISKAGIALVLSSQAHKDSELMSNRLFESIAAGALIICDENPFAKTFFGDSLLYIDGRSTIDQIYAHIVSHVEWANTHPKQALDMIARAQAIFRERFTLLRNLSDLYNGLNERKRQLAARQNPPELCEPSIRVNMLMRKYSEVALRNHFANLAAQNYSNISAVLVVDSNLSKVFLDQIHTAVKSSRIPIEVLEVTFFRYGVQPETKAARNLGAVIAELLKLSVGYDAFMVVAPNEKLMSNHLTVLAGALQRDPHLHCAATAAVLLKNDAAVNDVHELIDFGHVNIDGPPGYGRFIFRMASMPTNLDIALPYLHGRPLAVLIGSGVIAQQLPATISLDLMMSFPEREWDEAAENEVIWACNPKAMMVRTGFGARPQIAPPAVWRPEVSKIRKAFRLLSISWIKAQILAIGKQGLSARLKILKTKVLS